MKIKSAYCNKELDFDVVEKPDPNTNQTMLLIKHDSLRDVIYNQLKITKNGAVDYNYVKADTDHAVVECIIDDGEGRVVKEIGEAVPQTLENDVARSYPVLIASQRAFDRAAILLLMLAGKQLSNGEMGEFLALDLEPAIPKDIAETADMDDIDDNQSDEIPYMNAPIENVMMDIPDGIDNVEEASATSESEVTETAEPVDNSARITEIGNTVFGVGKYSGKPNTIAQIQTTDAEYFRKLLQIPKPAASLAEKLALVREYVEAIK